MAAIPDATVYVVDDDPAIRHSMRRLMASAGLAVKTFPSANSFLRSFDPNQPGCVVSDVRMPEMSGLELQDELRRRGRSIPFIMVTGYADAPMAVRSLKSGAFDFIEKPIEPQALVDRVHQALDRDRRQRRRGTEQRAVETRLGRLTPRERQVLDMVVSGKRSHQIAAELGLATKTVHIHRANIMGKMQAGSVAELTRMVVTARVRREER